MSVKRLTEHHLESLSLKGGCRGSSESIHVKKIHCWKSHAVGQLCHVYPNLMSVRSVSSDIAAAKNGQVDLTVFCRSKIAANLPFLLLLLLLT